MKKGDILTLLNSTNKVGSGLLLCFPAWLPQCCVFCLVLAHLAHVQHFSWTSSFPSRLYSCQLFRDRERVCENLNSLMWKNSRSNKRGDMGVRSLSSRDSLFEIISITRANCWEHHWFPCVKRSLWFAAFSCPAFFMLDGGLTVVALWFLFLPGLVEGGSQWPSGICTSCLCEKTGSCPVCIPREPPGGAGQHSTATGANRQPVRSDWWEMTLPALAGLVFASQIATSLG